MTWVWGKLAPAAAILLAVPGIPAAMGLSFGNAAPVVTSLSVSPDPVPADAGATIACGATDDAGVAQLTLAVSGGGLPGGGVTYSVSYAPARPSVSEQVTWATPGPGTFQVTCSVADTGGAFGGALTRSSSVTVQTVTLSNPPGIDALTASTTSVSVGEQVRLSATAHGDGLSFAWTATGGAFASTGASATWTAPESTGKHTLTVTATDALGRHASASVDVQVLWARPLGPWSEPSFFPSRIAVDAFGNTYVSDPRAGRIVVFDASGAVSRRIRVGGFPSGLAVSQRGELFVADLEAGRVDVYDESGRRLRALGAGAHELAVPLGVSIHPTSGRVYVADAGAAAIRIFEPGGAPVGRIDVDGSPAAIAFDPLGLRTYVSDGKRARVLVLDPAGALVGTLGTATTLTRPAGVAVASDGSIYVVDSFQSRAVVFSPGGAVVAYVGGGYGSDPGQLNVPFDIALDRRARLLVTNTQLGRIEAFALRGSGGGCAGDSDCDGMPDGWEIANGLDPLSAADARLDADGDGLSNLDEYRHGTEPRRADTDGDGILDGLEVLAGLDPAASDRPEIVTAAAKESDPGLVRLSASLRSSIPCEVSWRRVNGLDVVLRNANGLSPSFIGRAAGKVRLDAVGTCGPVQSLPAGVDVTIRNVAPRPDAGRTTVIAAGTGAVLDGGFTRDGNGDPVSLAWAQTLGPPLTCDVQGPLLPVEARRPGLSSFQLSAEDARGGRADGEVALLVVPAGSATPTAVAETPVLGHVGAPVALDASASVALGARFAWRQVDGPAVSIAGASSPVASFVPVTPGRYAFVLELVEPSRRSPAATIDVFVAAPGSDHARALISPPPAAEMGRPLALDGAASTGGSGLRHAWRQVSGPAAGLTDADRPVATVVPFEPGSFVFELEVTDDAGPGVPARVRLDAREAQRDLPVASAVAPASAQVRDVVRLDGAASRDPQGSPLRYRWTQVAGPWVALDDPTSSTPAFRPPLPGAYAFELEVDDGWRRSAPATVVIGVEPSHARGEGR